MRIAALGGALLLAGCATTNPTMKHHVIKPQAVQSISTKPATFNERFGKFSGKLKWTH